MSVLPICISHAHLVPAEVRCVCVYTTFYCVWALVCICMGHVCHSMGMKVREEHTHALCPQTGLKHAAILLPQSRIGITNTSHHVHFSLNVFNNLFFLLLPLLLNGPVCLFVCLCLFSWERDVYCPGWLQNCEPLALASIPALLTCSY